MRATGQDIVELFGYQPDDTSEEARQYWNTKQCPFTNRQCIKIDHSQGIVYGTCSVTGRKEKGKNTEVIVCPNRFYAETYEIFSDVTRLLWPGQEKSLIIGGDIEQLKKKAETVEHPIIAFGQHSGREIQIRGKNTLSLDWIFQSYTRNTAGELVPGKFVGLELQSIDITGNYRDNWSAYKKQKEGSNSLMSVPKSGHGLNWANVHKRLIPQIIRKGNIYGKSERCAGFFFVIPESVFRKFEDVTAGLKPVSAPAKENLSVITYKLGEPKPFGVRRSLEKVREIHYGLNDFALSFIGHCPEEAPLLLDTALSNVFK